MNFDIWSIRFIAYLANVKINTKVLTNLYVLTLKETSEFGFLFF